MPYKNLSASDFEKILHNVYGTIMVADKDKTIIFANRKVLEIFHLSEEEILGKTIDDLLSEGILFNSATKDVYKSKKLEIRYVKGRMDNPILTMSNPVFDETGELQMVVALSLEEDFLESIAKEISIEKAKAKELFKYLSGNKNSTTKIITENPVMKEVFFFLSKISKVDSTILLNGESGTGKEIVSRFIHENSPRNSEIFIPVNCAAIPAELMESEFFGYERGAFTGANREGKAGIFELADKGTLFLDEIGEMPLPIQSKLLRVLESGEIKRLGSEKTKHVDVRIIAASNRNLLEMINNGKFREDLYYRLNVIPITLPPLRERPEDIIPLAKQFLLEYNKKYGVNKVLSKKALDRLASYNWPGNVRELRNVIERTVIISTTNVLDFDLGSSFMPLDFSSKDKEKGKHKTVPANTAIKKSLKETLQSYEERVIRQALDENNNNVALTAKALGLHKSALYRKLAQFKA